VKKRNLTMDKQIGIYGLALLVFLVIFGSQDVLALSDITTNPVSLNVNAATQVVPATTNALINKFTYYSSPSGLLQNVSTGWAEKALYGSVVAAPSTTTATVPTPANAEVKLTVTVKAPTTTTLRGDLIIKVDQMTVVGSGLVVQSFWLREYFISGTGPFGTDATIIGLTANGETPTGSTVAVDNSGMTTLSSLCLYTDMTLTTSGTTITLLDFTTKFKMSSHIIITAVLVDSVLDDNPQVMGVDVKTIYFNYVDPTTPKTTYRPIWLDLVMAGGSS
jgi:hypothetical protein